MRAMKTLQGTLLIGLILLTQAARAEGPVDGRRKDASEPNVLLRKPAAPTAERRALAKPEPEQPANTREVSDAWSRLKVLIRKEKLGPLCTVLPRRGAGRLHAETIKVAIKTIPAGAALTHGRKALGSAPLVLEARPGSTPLDLVVRRAGFMTVRTRIHRDRNRTYTLRLHPAKLN
jgi:hypothetical protein